MAMMAAAAEAQSRRPCKAPAAEGAQGVGCKSHVYILGKVTLLRCYNAVAQSPCPGRRLKIGQDAFPGIRGHNCVHMVVVRNLLPWLHVGGDGLVRGLMKTTRERRERAR